MRRGHFSAGTEGARGSAACGAFRREGGGCPPKREKPDTGQRGELLAQGAELARQTVRCSVKWLFRDVMRPSLDSRLISAESALRSTQR